MRSPRCRSQRKTVSARTRISASRHRGQYRERKAQSNRSHGPNRRCLDLERCRIAT